MNREIKFRIWDITNDRMVGNVDFDILWFNKNELDRFDDVIPQQYTGLKDKNGKEVYEGDIVQYDGLYRAIIHINGEYKLETMYSQDDGSPYTLGLYTATLFGVSVVGNIYENPELLGEKNRDGISLACIQHPEHSDDCGCSLCKEDGRP